MYLSIDMIIPRHVYLEGVFDIAPIDDYNIGQEQYSLLVIRTIQLKIEIVFKAYINV